MFAFLVNESRPVKTVFFRKVKVALFVMLGLYGLEILQVDRKLYGYSELKCRKRSEADISLTSL